MAGNVHKGLCVLVAVLATAGMAPAAVDITYALEGHWTFDDAGDQLANDTSGNGKHATLGAGGGVGVDDPTWVDHGLLGSALYFDGGDYLKTSNIFGIGAGAVTYAMLVKQTNADGYQYVISNKEEDYIKSFFRVGFNQNDGKIRVYSEDQYDDKYRYVSPNSYTNAWHHIVVTRSSTTGKLYVDGQFIEDFTTMNGNLGTTSDPWFIGQSGTGEDFFKGYIDEVRIYSRRLTDDDIAALYIATIPEPGTLAVLAVGSLIALARRRRTA